jgi:hypothetical protein
MLVRGLEEIHWQRGKSFTALVSDMIRRR